VRGRVQGVGFRWFVRAEAERLGLHGWVRNASDGSVEVCVEGDPRALADLTSALALGPPGARVDRLEHRRGPAMGDLIGFRIRTGSHPGD
jgi:acylphosphatase